MKIEIEKYIDKSVLCWLATVDEVGHPNVSPKEMFTHHNGKLIIANIASPQSMKNLSGNDAVCVSMVNVFTQKGIKLKGRARIINTMDVDFKENESILIDLYSDVYTIKSIIEVSIEKVETILAPSYVKFPERTEEMQIANAMETYKVKPN